MYLARTVTFAFCSGTLRIPGMVVPIGWHDLQEVHAVNRLRYRNASPRAIRLFLTFVCAMDRARLARPLPRRHNSFRQPAMGL